MTLLSLVGTMATVVSVTSFLPQVIRCWRTKRTKDISLSAYILLETGAILWFTYGALGRDMAVMVTNSLIGILVASMIFLKLQYK